MNIQQVLDRQLPELDPETPLRSFLVAPSPDELPDDGVLSYVVISDPFQLKDVEERTVLLFRPEMERFLSLLASNQDVFGVHIRTLVGLPRATYSVSWEQASWNLEQVSYSPLVSEIALSLEVSAQSKLANASQHDKERDRVTRSNGTVKSHTAFDLALPEEDDAMDQANA